MRHFAQHAEGMVEEKQEFKANLSYTVKPCLSHQKKVALSSVESVCSCMYSPSTVCARRKVARACQSFQLLEDEGQMESGVKGAP